MSAAAILLAFVTAERLAELAWARRNTALLLASGGREEGAGHYPFIIALHGAWLGGLWLAAWDRPVNGPFLAIFLTLQLFRLWILLSLGSRWTTRIIVVPGENPVRRGPYRLLKHPNYVIVAGEIAALPLAFGLGLYALVFSVLNAAVLAVRIRAENAALSAMNRGAGPS